MFVADLPDFLGVTSGSVSSVDTSPVSASSNCVLNFYQQSLQHTILSVKIGTPTMLV